jgi:DNA-binding response OmpR family regulator
MTASPGEKVNDPAVVEPNHAESPQTKNLPVKQKKTILIFSADLSFSLNLTTFFQDRYDVITTTDSEVLGIVALHTRIDLVIIDADPSSRIIERIQRLRESGMQLPVMMLYVYGPRGQEMDAAIRRHVNAVLYKPFDVRDVARRVEELMGI